MTFHDNETILKHLSAAGVDKARQILTMERAKEMFLHYQSNRNLALRLQRSRRERGVQV